MPNDHWRTGYNTTVRYVWREKVRDAAPVIVVEDRPNRIVLFTRMGTPVRRTTIDYRAGTISEPQPATWHTTHNLLMVEPDKGYSISAMYRGSDGRFLCWYIDLIEPIRRASDGVVLSDLALDIVVAPDFTWKMKDEDHFQRLQELDWITPARAAQVLRDKDEAIARIERRAAPFNEDWPNWRPDPSWLIPELPDDWARTPA
jgi:hypothetical protein